MTERESPREGELILYQTKQGRVRVEVLYEDETFWLNQGRIADLFGVTVPTVSHHLTEIYGSGELTPEATLRKILRVQRECERDVRREIEFYNLDAIISVGYRVNSAQATQFRIWATQTLRIRASERRFYRKVTDFCEQCSIDYDKDGDITRVQGFLSQESA